MSTTSTITPGELEDALREMSREDMCRLDTTDHSFHWETMHDFAPLDWDTDGTVLLFNLHRQCVDGLAVHHTMLNARASIDRDWQVMYVDMVTELDALLYAQRVSLATGMRGRYQAPRRSRNASIIFSVRGDARLVVFCPELTDTCLDLLHAGGVILPEGGNQA